eukprot:SAG25_NODE_123_length_14620_cov_73.222161_2_plen_81_part_00
MIRVKRVASYQRLFSARSTFATSAGHAGAANETVASLPWSCLTAVTYHSDIGVHPPARPTLVSDPERALQDPGSRVLTFV